MHLLFDQEESAEEDYGLTTDQLFTEIRKQKNERFISVNSKNSSKSHKTQKSHTELPQSQQHHCSEQQHEFEYSGDNKLPKRGKNTKTHLPHPTEILAGQRRSQQHKAKRLKYRKQQNTKNDYLDENTLAEVNKLMKKVEEHGKRCHEWNSIDIEKWAKSIRENTRNEDWLFQNLPEIVAVVSRANQLSTSLFINK